MRVCSQCGLVLADDNPIEHCGGAPHDVEPLSVPAPIAARFRVIEPFAHGNTGTTYIAEKVDDGFRGLLKVVRPELTATPQERQRLKRELRKQSSLTNNSLVRIIDGGEIDGTVWLFRDHVEGESLRTRIAKHGKLEAPEALAVIAQVASGLDELHRQGLLHRDVTPGHILLVERPEGVPGVKLIDAAIAQHQKTSGVFDLVGTPRYMSPEQVAGKAVSFRSDLYSLGGVLFEALTGSPPFDLEAQELLDAHSQQPPPALEGDFPGPVVQLVANLLAKEPRRRPFSAQQVRRTLDPLLPEGTPPARSGSTTAVGNVPAPGPDSGRPAGLPPTPAVARELPPTPGRRRDPTEEILLETIDDDVEPTQVIAQVNVDGQGRPRQATLALSPEEFDEMEVEDAGEESVEDSVEDIDIAPEPSSEDATVIREAPAELLAATANISSPSTAPPPPVGDSTAPQPRASVPPPGETTPRDAERKQADFSVESLFEGDKSSSELAKSIPKAARLPREASEIPAAAAPDAEGTMVIKMPQRNANSRLPLAAGLLIAIVGGFYFMSGDDSGAVVESAGATAGGTEGSSGQGTDTTGNTAAGNTTADSDDSPSTSEGQAAQGQAANTEPKQADDGAAAAAEPAPEAAPTAAKAAEPKQPRTTREERLAAAPRARKPQVSDNIDYKALARKHYKAGRYAPAAAAYEKASIKSPRDAGAFAGLGASELARGRAGAAIRAYQRAVQLKPRTSGFHAALGRAYYQKGDGRRAKKAYEKALKLNPNNSAAKRAISRL